MGDLRDYVDAIIHKHFSDLDTAVGAICHEYFARLLSGELGAMWVGLDTANLEFRTVLPGEWLVDDLPTWPPVLATRTLTPNAERNRKVFTDTYAGRKCQCTASWTCDMCRHPGNPKIQDENPFCWDITPDPVSDVVDATVYRKKVSEW